MLTPKQNEDAGRVWDWYVQAAALWLPFHLVVVAEEFVALT